MASSRELRLLYIEDDKEVRTMTARLFEHFFKDITLCAHGKEGLDAFQRESFDLIITDINMPIMDGTEMIEQIRLEDTFIPILVLSAQNALERLGQDVNGYIAKPMQQLKFLDLLEHTVRYIVLKKKLDRQYLAHRGTSQGETRYTGTYL